MRESRAGKVVAMALRTAEVGPMKEIREAAAIENEGIEGDLPSPAARGVTFLSKEQWTVVQQELDVDLPWHARRANILIEGIDLPSCIGKVLHVGSAVVKIEDEARPCHEMDIIQPGLQNALTLNGRGGVRGRILQTGHIRVGDAVTVQDKTELLLPAE